MTTIPIAAPDHELVTSFEGWVRTATVNATTGDLHLTIGIPPEYKMQAMESTQYPGLMFRVDMWKKKRRRRREGSDEV